MTAIDTGSRTEADAASFERHHAAEPEDDRPTPSDFAEEARAEQEHAARQALEASLTAARDALAEAVRQYGVLVDELYTVEFSETVDGAGLGEVLDQAGTAIRSAQRTARLLCQRCER